ncbi:hypothetical protein ABTP16_12050, partial [Acinetobacter baumannii]
ALLHVLYISPYNVKSWLYKGLLFVACMVVSVFLFGGLVIGLWHLWERTSLQNFDDADTADHNEIVREDNQKLYKNSGKEKYANSVQYGRRPDFGEIYESMSQKWGNVDIGVIVCGPPTLQTTVARECRTQNLKRRANEAIFHFNSHSFDL